MVCITEKSMDTGTYRRANPSLKPEIEKATEWSKHGLQEYIHVPVKSTVTN